MEVARIIVYENIAHISDLKKITAGMVGATIRVEYVGSSWDEMSRTAVFKGVETKDILNAGNVMEIPPETIHTANKHLQVGFYGTNLKTGIVIPTIWVDLGLILPSADPSGDSSTEKTLPVWAQLSERLDDLQDQVDNLSTGGAPGPGGGVQFEVDETLRLENGVLSVNTTDQMEQDNTLPITSAGVFATVGNIEALLKTI